MALRLDDFYMSVVSLQWDLAAFQVNELYRLKALMSELDWKHESIESLKLQVLPPSEKLKTM